jgi:hypothetical protein
MILMEAEAILVGSELYVCSKDCRKIVSVFIQNILFCLKGNYMLLWN